jgi:flagellar motor switch protein FliN/FliY
MSDESQRPDPVDDDWAAALAEQAADDETQGQMPPELEEAVRPAEFDDLQDEGGRPLIEPRNLDVILDIPVTISMEIGRTSISIRNLLQLNQGSVVELNRLAGEPMDVLVNGCLVAHGEVVVVNEKFGIRLTDVISPQERVKKLR